MADHQRTESSDSGYGDIPGRDREEIRDETADEEEFEDTEDLDEEEDDVDLGKDVREQEAAVREWPRG